MIVRDFMKHTVVSTGMDTTIREAASAMVKRHVGSLPVVDEHGKPVGIIGLRDLVDLELPDFVRFVEDVDFVHDFGAVETTRPDPGTLSRPITSLMKPITTIEEDCGLLRAYALMLQHNILDMPVVDTKGKLTGIVSRVDIGTAIISQWSSRGAKK